MKMTFPQYIQNPMGIANSVISNREMYRTLYTEKLNKIMVRENGKVDYKLYKKKDSYIIYIKIPSEVVPNFYYDTVVEFTPPEKTTTVLPNLEKYNVKFYSNDPSFVFTYAHAFIKNDLFIKDLEPKMSNTAVKKNASEKNPNNLVGYVKSLYFAWLIIKSRGLLSKTHYITAPEFKLKEFLNQIQDADSKIEDRQRSGDEITKKKKVVEKPTRDVIRDRENSNGISSKNIKFTSKSKTINSSKNVSKSKKVKKK